MKKSFKFLLFVLIIALSLSSLCFIGCDFIDQNGLQGGDGGDVIKPETNDPYEKQDVNVELQNSFQFAEEISVGDASHDGSPFSSVTDAIEQTKVNRASVAIFVLTADASYGGSGVIIDVDDGIDFGEDEDNIFYVITCYHVIDVCEMNDNEVHVYVPDANARNYDDVGYNEEFAFKGKVGGDINLAQSVSLVGGDMKSDIAVLRLYIQDQSVASEIVKAKVMSPDYSLRLGETVFAIGNTKSSHGGWTTVGNVSDVDCIEEVDGIGDMALIGINVDIYPGNSGGGLFNLYGELVGITSAGETITDVNGNTSSIGINLAVPHKVHYEDDTGFINIVKHLIGSFIKNGKEGNNYGYISGRVDSNWFAYAELNGNLVISDIVAGSQAEDNVRVGDYITSVSINSGKAEQVSTRTQLKSILASLKVGDTVKFNMVRASDYGLSTQYSRTFTAKQFYFCNTGDYTNIEVA